MAKQATTSKSQSDRKATDDEVEEAIKKLQAFYDQGGKVVLLEAKSRNFDVEHEAKRRGMKVNKMNKACAFSRAYTPEKLNSIFEACRKSHTALVWGILDELLAVPDRRRRETLLKGAIKHRWSVRTLKMKTRLLRPANAEEKQDRAGRRQPLAENLGELLDQMKDFCRRWREWHKGLEKDERIQEEGEGTTIADANTLRIEILAGEPELAAEIKRTNGALNRLGKVVLRRLSEEQEKTLGRSRVDALKVKHKRPARAPY